MCVCVFQSGQFSEDMIPTVGFNMRKITKGNVTIKVSTSAPCYIFFFFFFLLLVVVVLLEILINTIIME